MAAAEGREEEEENKVRMSDGHKPRRRRRRALVHSIHHVGCCRPRKKKKTSQNSHTHKYKKKKYEKMKRKYKAPPYDGLLLIESKLTSHGHIFTLVSFIQCWAQKCLFLNTSERKKNDRFLASDYGATASRNVNARLPVDEKIPFLMGRRGGVINPGRQSADDDGQALRN